MSTILAVVFTVKSNQCTSDGSDTKLPQAVAAAAIDLQKWTSSIMRMVWVVKWSAKGIMPICPKVVVVKAFKLDPAKAVRLTYQNG